jgi:GT2 family glycosyltransferase
MTLENFISEKVSILICSKNRRRMLESLVKDLQQQYSDYSVKIVVVEECDSGAAISGVKYFCHQVSDRGFGYARNLALKNASSDIIVFIDDDCKVLCGWLEKLIQPMFADSSLLGVQGGVTVPKQSNIIGWAESILGFPGGGIKRIVEAKGINIETKEISTLNCAYRRKAIDAVGGFDEQFKLGGEDYILAKQVSNYGKCLFVPSAMVMHESRGCLKKIWSWFVRRGKAEVKVIQSRKYNKANYKSIIRGSLGIKLTLLILAGIFISNFITYPFGIIIFIYGFVIYSRYFKIWKSSQVSIFAFVVLPVVKVTMDLATDWGRLKAIIYR